MAKVVEEKLDRPMQPTRTLSGLRSMTARANSAPGSIILLKNSHFYIEEEDRGKDADSSKIKADPKKVKDG